MEALPQLDLGVIGNTDSAQSLPETFVVDLSSIEVNAPSARPLVQARTLKNCEAWLPSILLEGAGRGKFATICVNEDEETEGRVLRNGQATFSLTTLYLVRLPDPTASATPKDDGLNIGLIVGVVVGVVVVVAVVIVVVILTKKGGGGSSGSISSAGA
jgi:hypothetical protein